jgi:hypothetical protein
MCPLHQLLLGQSAGASGTVPGGEGAANADSVDDTGYLPLGCPPVPGGLSKNHQRASLRAPCARRLRTTGRSNRDARTARRESFRRRGPYEEAGQCCCRRRPLNSIGILTRPMLRSRGSGTRMDDESAAFLRQRVAPTFNRHRFSGCCGGRPGIHKCVDGSTLSCGTTSALAAPTAGRSITIHAIQVNTTYQRVTVSFAPDATFQS